MHQTKQHSYSLTHVYTVAPNTKLAHRRTCTYRIHDISVVIIIADYMVLLPLAVCRLLLLLLDSLDKPLNHEVRPPASIGTAGNESTSGLPRVSLVRVEHVLGRQHDKHEFCRAQRIDQIYSIFSPTKRIVLEFVAESVLFDFGVANNSTKRRLK